MTIDYRFYLLILLIGLWLVWRWKRGLPIIRLPAITLPGAPTNVIEFVRENQKVTLVAWFTLLCYVLCLVFFPDTRDFLLSFVGIGLLLLAMVGYLTFVWIKSVFWQSSWITALIMMTILIVLLDLGISGYIPEGTWEKSSTYQKISRWWSTPSTSRSAAVTRSECSGSATLVFDTNPKVVNPNGACRVRLNYPGNCMFFRRAAFTGDPTSYGPICDRDGENTLAPNDIELAWSATGPFSGRVILLGR